MHIDLNADVGESFGSYVLGDDDGLVPWITSANIACGFHAGDPNIMARTVALCRRHGVALGAHPGVPDLQGFGRREVATQTGEARDWVLYQVGALDAFARAAGGRLRHVKPHGALYHMAARDSRVAGEVAAAVRSLDPTLLLVAPPGSALERSGAAEGLKVFREAFPERGYLPDGSLAPRSRPDALVRDPAAVARRAVSLCREGYLPAVDGTPVRLEAETLCLHGDTPGAPSIARAVREALEAAGVRVAPD